MSHQDSWILEDEESIRLSHEFENGTARLCDVPYCTRHAVPVLPGRSVWLRLCYRHAQMSEGFPVGIGVHKTVRALMQMDAGDEPRFGRLGADKSRMESYVNPGNITGFRPR